MNFGTNKKSCHDKLGIHHLEITEKTQLYHLVMEWLWIENVLQSTTTVL